MLPCFSSLPNINTDFEDRAVLQNPGQRLGELFHMYDMEKVDGPVIPELNKRHLSLFSVNSKHLPFRVQCPHFRPTRKSNIKHALLITVNNKMQIEIADN